MGHICAAFLVLLRMLVRSPVPLPHSPCAHVQSAGEEVSPPSWLRPPAGVKHIGEGALRGCSRGGFTALFPSLEKVDRAVAQQQVHVLGESH